MSGNENNASSLAERAVSLGLEGYSSSEAMLVACAPLIGIPEGLALRAACGLAGGCGLSGGTCGVVTAAVIAIGLRFAPKDPSDTQARIRAMHLCAEFTNAFAARHGSLLCSELCLKLCPDVDLRSKDGAKTIRETGMPNRLLRSAGEMIEK